MKLKFIKNKRKKFKNKKEIRDYYDDLADNNLPLYKQTILSEINDDIIVYTSWGFLLIIINIINFSILTRFIILKNNIGLSMCGGILLLSFIILIILNQKLKFNAKSLTLINNLLNINKIYNVK